MTTLYDHLGAWSLHRNDRKAVVDAVAAIADAGAQLAEVIASCDVVIGRAGASTVAELCVLGAASILVPLPNSPGDHQRHNAEMLQRVGAAIVIEHR